MILDWINNRFGTHFDEKQLQSVKDFALIWNIFEAKVCSSQCTIQTMQNAFATKSFSIGDFEDTLNYFKNRYIENGVPNQRFGYLYFRANDRPQLVIDVLTNQTTNTQDIVLAIAIIVYRLRNNLFHGLKNIRTINEQDKNFAYSNSFLKKVLDYFP